jgi:anaerobic magnesium-protoporphyrin IX monomethyl ester cyclase
VAHGCEVLLIGFEAQENLGLRSIAAFLESRGISTAIEPIHGVTKEDILRRVRARGAKIVGFSVIFQRMLGAFAELIGYLRASGIGGHFTAGGHLPTFEPETMLASIDGLDSVIRHEGELTLAELYEKIDRPGEWDGIDGLVFRADGGVRVNRPRALIEDLDSLPLPLREAGGGITHRGIDVRSIVGSRGCYSRCSFCSITEFYRSTSGPLRRTRSPGSVVGEMETLYGDFGTRVFIFQDDDIFMRTRRHREWLEAFLRELRRARLHDKTLWRISCRVDDLDLDLIRRMSDHGLGTIYLGIESGSDSELRTINKGYSARDSYAAVELLRESGVAFEFGFMLFTPDTTLQALAENIEFLRLAGSAGTVVNFCKMAPYAGTAIERRLRAEGRLVGTAAAPDYSYEDGRVRLFQLFSTQAFQHRNFDDDGLVELIRFARFDALVARRLIGTAGRDYEESVRGITLRANTAALDALTFAHALIAENPLEATMDHWGILEEAVRAEQGEENALTEELVALMSQNGATLSRAATLS